MEKNRKNKVTQQIRKTNVVKSMPPQSYAKESQQQTLLWPLSLVSCLCSAHKPPYRKQHFLSVCLGSFQVENQCLTVFNNVGYFTHACCSSVSDHGLLCQVILKQTKQARSLLLSMFQICKLNPFHYLHIHLGICLLMQNYPKVQIPSFCHRLAICYQHPLLQQTGLPASRDESVGKSYHFCFSISALKHLQKLQLYSCNNTVHSNK